MEQVITDWLVQPPSLRVPKRKDGKDGSDSSSSSSSSSSSDENKLKTDIGAKIPKPAKGECQICLKVFGMFKRPVCYFIFFFIILFIYLFIYLCSCLALSATKQCVTDAVINFTLS